MEYAPLPRDLALFARDELARFRVPGMSVGVVHGGQVYAQGFGITSIANPLAVTPETLFQIGSTSKTFTATAAMMLAEEGRLDLEARVRHYLPDFALESEPDAERVTIRHLVTHRGGWVGDYFKDTGRGDDAIAKIVAKMVRSPQLVPAGTAFSYSNAGFYVVGRVKVITGEPFDAFIRSRIMLPLGMALSTYFPEDAMLHRFATGHILEEPGPRIAVPWRMPRSIGPGGGVISNAVEQAQYLAFHLGDGSTAGGTRLLQTATMAMMQSPQATAGSMCDEIGISWMLEEVGGERLVKHGGSTIGQLSSFEFVPSRGFGVTVLTNCDSGRELRQTVADACRVHFTGLSGHERHPSPRLPGNAADFEGEYEATLARLTVGRDGSALVVLEATSTGRTQVPLGTDGMHLGFFEPDRAVVLHGPRQGETTEFLRGPSGEVEWMRWDGRLARRRR